MPDFSPRLRAARLSDLDDLQALEYSSFATDRMSRRQMRYHIANPMARLWVCADADDRPVASLLGLFHNGRPPRIYSVATAEAYRGRGLGEALVRAFLKECKKNGAAKAVLEVRQSAGGAIRLYEKLGFTAARTLPGYYEDGEDGIKMVMNFA